MLSDSSTFVLQTSPVAAHRSRELGSFRPSQLLPPLSISIEHVPRRRTQLSPLCPPNVSRGRERTQFEAMLQASRERSAILGVKKPLELRKEIAVKAQKVTQIERRARFLIKLYEPPSPSAADSPVTPPDSPTIFHFSLPSPGLQSPLEVFEDVHDHPERYRNSKRVEQVDFGLRYKKHVNIRPHRHSSPSVKNCVNLLPSLDQISQRLNKALVSSNAIGSQLPERGRREKSRLPSFLRSHSSSPLPEATPASTDQPPRRPRPIPPRLALHPPTPPGNHVVQSSMSQHAAFLEFSTLDKGLVSQITMSLCPPPGSKSSQALPPETAELDSEQSRVISEGTTTTVTDDIAISGLRAQLTKDMFNKLSRRTPGIPNAVACGIKARDDTSQAASGNEFESKTRRRCSAPAEVPTAQRGAHHPVLEKPGGF